MNRRSQITEFFIDRLFLSALILAVILITFPERAMAQKASDAELEDALWICLRGKFPGMEREIGDHTRAFDPQSGRNFAYENGAWIDVKTGECMCPKCPPTAAQTTPTPTPAAAETTTPKSANEPQKVEEKKEPSWWETLIPALIPSIGIGGGRERERREPRNPCAGK